ncbi:TMV resistance protein N-like [Senna tora]|uniref:TMV resistance protein N-like n=1 Tax=Senna tora TaxID=362788 RepID=A0A834SNX2_9FABA|nr:TMV resistance protein N-like [Senna tora]
MAMIKKGWNAKDDFSIIEENMEEMGAKVGDVLVIENPIINGRLIRNFARARVMVDLLKPLVVGLWVSRPNLPSIWISMKFEKLSQFFFKCGILGHDSKSCKNREGARTKDGKPLYGAWVGVAPVRVWEDAVVKCKAGWNQVEEWRPKVERGPTSEREAHWDEGSKSNDWASNREGDFRNDFPDVYTERSMDWKFLWRLRKFSQKIGFTSMREGFTLVSLQWLWWLAGCSHLRAVIVLSRNCQGVGVALTVRALRELCRIYKPPVVFLMETKRSGEKMEEFRLRNRFQFDRTFYVDLEGESGGLALWWKEEKERRIVWDKLRAMGGNIQGSWFCLGDFIDVLYHSEKWGGRPKSTRKLRECFSEDFAEELKSKSEELIRCMEEVWDKEEKYWFQRSRRRQRNKILRIKSVDDQWILNEEGIAACFAQFYSDLFRFGGRTDLSKVLSYVNPVISQEENEALLKDISYLEVKEAAF